MIAETKKSNNINNLKVESTAKSSVFNNQFFLNKAYRNLNINETYRLASPEPALFVSICNLALSQTMLHTHLLMIIVVLNNLRTYKNKQLFLIPPSHLIIYLCKLYKKQASTG